MAQRYGWDLDYIRSLYLDDVAKLMVVYKEEATQADKKRKSIENKMKKAKGAS